MFARCDPESILSPCQEKVAVELRQVGERDVLAPLALTKDSYSTGRLLSGSPRTPREMSGRILLTTGESMFFEQPNARITDYCRSRGLSLDRSAVFADVEEKAGLALNQILPMVPTLLQAVSQLSWNCHVILAECDNYDTSYSDPDIPFTIFVSVPHAIARKTYLRIAENIVHETMHLQLTLFERVCPLVDTTIKWSLFSPWKQSERETQGILHGLYVFYSLKWMWHQIGKRSEEIEDQSFATNRLQEINAEIEAVTDVQNSPALTTAGRFLVSKMLGSQ